MSNRQTFYVLAPSPHDAAYFKGQHDKLSTQCKKAQKKRHSRDLILNYYTFTKTNDQNLNSRD